MMVCGTAGGPDKASPIGRRDGSADSAGFRAYTQCFVQAMRDVLGAGESSILSEAAFPAYAHPNVLIGSLFWERIRAVMRYLGDAPRGTVVDFGCGGGVMLPFLAERS